MPHKIKLLFLSQKTVSSQLQPDQSYTDGFQFKENLFPAHMRSTTCSLALPCPLHGASRKVSPINISWQSCHSNGAQRYLTFTQLIICQVSFLKKATPIPSHNVTFFSTRSLIFDLFSGAILPPPGSDLLRTGRGGGGSCSRPARLL